MATTSAGGARSTKGKPRKPVPSHRLLPIAPPIVRLTIAAGFGVAVGLLAPLDQTLPRVLAGWNAAGLVYLAMALLLMFRAEEEHIKKQAAIEERSRTVVLALVVICALAMLLAIVAQLSALTEGHQVYKVIKLGLSFSTLLVSWFLVHTVYALFYAHEYHAAHVSRTSGGEGLKFPGGQTPDYLDFLYFAFGVGTTAQTADVEITSHRMRHIVTVHGLLSFFINTSVIALMVNITTQFVS
jgi:uncharacterized membrane protein